MLTTKSELMERKRVMEREADIAAVLAAAIIGHRNSATQEGAVRIWADVRKELEKVRGG